MTTNSKLVHTKQQRIQARVSKSDSYRFFNLLTGPEMLSKVEELLPERHRERQFPPTETLSMFLAQAMNEDRSCQKVVNDAAIKRVMGGLSLCSTSTSGYCQARQRLPLEMISTLARYTGELMNKQIPDHWRWQGKRVHLIDGTTVSLPDTAANQAVYPQPSGQKPGLGFPICRIVGVVCLSSGAVLNASLGSCKGKGTSEQCLLRRMLGTFNTDDLVLGDAFFGTYFLLAALLDRGVDAVFEQLGARKRVTDFRQGVRLGPKDHLIELLKPKKKPGWMTQEDYDRAPDTLTIRELKIKGKVLITTLLSAKEFPKQELSTLYRKRWHVEVDLRNIKTTLGMETLSCKTPEMIEKEMWVYFLAYNLIRLLMAQSALLSDLQPRQLSFKHTVQLWLAWSQQTKMNGVQIDEGALFVLIAQKMVGNRPGRIEPRAVKRRPKPFSLLMERRELARMKVRIHGHPKKIKA
ncbi:Mobile element protein [hydrothermal vent metagenome]|uniref:Mobile element protein n=1 Tax=hydrothermal vent metagenome TaxID=652676 RepID=A0A3B0Z675_9ZZZZ